MPLSDISTINVSSAGAGVTRAGYGVPLIVSHTAAWTERVRTYTSLAGVQVDFAANTPEYLAASKIFSQSPKVTQIKIGRAALQPTQKFSVGVNTAALNTPYRVRLAVATGSAWVSQDATYNSGSGATAWTPSGIWSRGDLVSSASGFIYSCLGKSGVFGGFGNSTGFTGFGGASGPSGTALAIAENQIFWMFVGSGNTGSISSDAIINGLRAKVDYLAAPSVNGTGTGQLVSSLQGAGGAQTMQLLANTPAKFFGLQVYDRNVLTSNQTQADPGIATDLAAIALENNDWYGLITLFNSEALADAAAAWVETATKAYPVASIDTQIPRVADTISTDVAHDIKAAAYARTWTMFHPSNDEFMDAAELGKWFPVSPGGETWRMKTLSGVTVENYTSTEITNMKAKYAHFYYNIGGRNVVGGDAKNGAAEYIDVVRFLDWYTSELQADLADLVIGVDKVPYTNPGIDLIEAKVTKRNEAGIRAGGIAANPAPVVTAPDISDVSASDKANRELSGVTTSWTLAGAIHHITVSVTASA